MLTGHHDIRQHQVGSLRFDYTQAFDGALSLENVTVRLESKY